MIWLEAVRPDIELQDLRTKVALLKDRLVPYGLGEQAAFWSTSHDRALVTELNRLGLPLEETADADLLLNQHYAIPRELLNLFRRTALLDIDPGLTQVWASQGVLQIAPHDIYFTIGETVGREGARFSDLGVPWEYTPPCVFLDFWAPARAAEAAPFTTVSHWKADEWMVEDGEIYTNDKRAGFLPFIELPRLTPQPLELAIRLGEWDQSERVTLEAHGWRVRDSLAVCSTPWAYQQYIQQSRGEFSCVKPSCIRLQNAWISDRTLCYLASGKPAVVQHTGPSRFLPDEAGLIRFTGIDDAARKLERAAADYGRHCRLARGLAEEHFDARKVAASVLERALA